MLAVRGCYLEPDWFDVPTVDVVGVEGSSTKSLCGFAQLETEKEAIVAFREWELQFSVHLEPPYLLEIGSGAEST